MSARRLAWAWIAVTAGCYDLRPETERRDAAADRADVVDARVDDAASDVGIDAAVDVGSDVGSDVANDIAREDAIDAGGGADVVEAGGAIDAPDVLDAPDVADASDVIDVSDVVDAADVVDAGDGDAIELCDARCQAWERCSAGRCVVSPAQAFAPGRLSTCLLRASGHVWCWGENASGQLGDGTRTMSLDPVRNPEVDDAVEIEAAGTTTCARRRSGAVYCWGTERGWGGAGGGRPTPFAGVTDAVSVSAGAGHVCAVSASGTARCGGSNSGGELGNGMTAATTTPVAVQNLSDAVEISVGGPGNSTAGFTCARRRDRSVVCWGDNTYGQLGTGNNTRSGVPVPVQGLSDAVEVVAGAYHACARRAGGAVVCWGRSLEGQIGDSQRMDRNAPTPVFNLSDAVDIDANAGFNCAVRTAGAVVCWGQNFNQQLGTNASGRDATVPVTIAGLADAIRVAVGAEHACAIRSGGGIVCWGKNDAGQVGDRTTGSPRPTPVTIQVP